MSQIKSRIYQSGLHNEGAWPERDPDKPKYLRKYWDSESQTFKAGYRPNPNNNFGTAPMVRFDSMPAEYHEGACRIVDSRAEWERLDKETGCLTFGSLKEPRERAIKEAKNTEKVIAKDRRNASLEAIRKVRANPTETRDRLQKEGEKQAETAKKSGLKELLKASKVKI